MAVTTFYQEKPNICVGGKLHARSFASTENPFYNNLSINTLQYAVFWRAKGRILQRESLPFGR